MEKNILEALEIITGGRSGGYYISGLFFSLLAITLSVYMHSRKRNVLSINTPQKFSWLFMMWDNFKRAVVGLILMFLIFRLFDLADNVAAMIGVGFFVAFGLDKAIQWLMDYTNIANFLKIDRTKITEKIESKKDDETV